MLQRITKEHRTKVSEIKVNRHCDECDFGYYEFTGKTLFHQPTEFVHKCTKCDSTVSLNRHYPYFETIEEDYFRRQ